MQAAYAEHLNVNISAQSAVLINADTGAVLYEKEAHRLAYPASITKVATALFALQRKGGALDEIVSGSLDALHVVPADFATICPYRLVSDGTHMGLQVGEAISLRALFYGLLLSSANDAANVIAESVSGSVSQFVSELNAYLHSQGWLQTHFCNPHGLHHPEHQTTAYEMALIARAALKNPFFQEVVKTVHYTRPKTNKQPALPLQQTTNRLLKGGECFYPKAIGIKTGHTSLAGYTLVAAAEEKGRRLIAVLLGCKEGMLRFKEAITLFEAAFGQSCIQRTLFAKEYDFFSTSVKGGKQELAAALGEDARVSYYPAEEPTLKTLVRWQLPPLPISKGAFVGELEIWDGSRCRLASVSLYAKSDIEATFPHLFLSWYTQGGRSLLLGLFGLSLLSAVFLFYQRKKG